MAESSAAANTDEDRRTSADPGSASARPAIEVVADPDPVVLRETPAIEVGIEVEVLSGFSHRWVPGFAVVESAEHGYRLRRISDRAVLPTWFGLDEVRTPAR